MIPQRSSSRRRQCVATTAVVMALVMAMAAACSDGDDDAEPAPPELEEALLAADDLGPDFQLDATDTAGADAQTDTGAAPEGGLLGAERLTGASEDCRQLLGRFEGRFPADDALVRTFSGPQSTTVVQRVAAGDVARPEVRLAQQAPEECGRLSYQAEDGTSGEIRFTSLALGRDDLGDEQAELTVRATITGTGDQVTEIDGYVVVIRRGPVVSAVFAISPVGTQGALDVEDMQRVAGALDERLVMAG